MPAKKARDLGRRTFDLRDAIYSAFADADKPELSGGKGTRSVELDALHPDKLRAIVREAIERHIPAGYMDALNAAEESGRTILDRMAAAAAG